MRDETRLLEGHEPTPPSWEVHEDLANVTWWHDCPSHAMRVPAVLPNTMAGWQVQQVEPLTLYPSILCRGCGCHGFIRNGQWVSA